MGEGIFFNGVHSALGFGAACAALVAIALWRQNAPNYAAIKAVVRPPAPGAPLAAAQLAPNDPLLPELSLASYDAAYLSRFIAAAQARQVGAVSALAFYSRPTLRPNDMRFAVALGAALILGNLAIARIAPLQP
jgi:hypothetical protein